MGTHLETFPARRTSARAWAIVAAVVLLLAALGAGVLIGRATETSTVKAPQKTAAGASEEKTFPGVEVVGKADCGSMAEEPVMVLTCDEVMSDPRVSGKSKVTLKFEEGPEGTIRFRGTYVLTNDGGTWEGPWVGLMLPDGNEDLVGVYEGTGDYEGLRYHQYLWHPAPGTTWTYFGWIEGGG